MNSMEADRLCDIMNEIKNDKTDQDRVNRRFMSQLFLEYQTQQERIAEERNEVIKVNSARIAVSIDNAGTKISNVLLNIDESLEQLIAAVKEISK